jgi:hypothetical protein
MFWKGASDRAVLKRLAKLVNADYLSRPTLHQRKTQPIPEPVWKYNRSFLIFFLI